MRLVLGNEKRAQVVGAITVMSDQSGLGASGVFRGWLEAPRSPYRVGVLTGEGVGPEVVGAALDVLSAVDGVRAARFDVRFGPEPSLAPGEVQGHITDDEALFCGEIFGAGGALLCGAKGGRFVYELREQFDLFCKLTPVRPLAPLAGVGPVKLEAAASADLLFVRENVGGLYFGSSQERSEGGRVEEAHHTFGYDRQTVERILSVAAELAASRRGRLSVVLKSAGIPGVSAVWRDALRTLDDRLGLTSECLEVDNACYQVVADSARFDVIVSPNLFGDVLADVAALLLGSRGVSYSANFGEDRKAVYQTGHGAAHDLAGGDRANPVGQILSLATLLQESFGLGELARAVRQATVHVLADGWRTADVMTPGCTQVGTRELGKRIAEHAHALGSGV